MVLPYEEILQKCRTSKQFNIACKSEDFWRLYAQKHRLGDKNIPTETWKDYVHNKLVRHNLLFTEPITYHGGGNVSTIDVNDRMYNLIKNGPTFTFNEEMKRKTNDIREENGFRKNCVGNAYVFGPLFPMKGYEEIASHNNDAAATGLIDMDIAGNTDTIDEDVYQNVFSKYGYDWDDRDLLHEYQEKYPAVIWIGSTWGGDVGATAYAHYDKNGDIDSLIIDTDCLISGIEDEGEEAEEDTLESRVWFARKHLLPGNEE
jgi:hypothetical protein